MYSDISVMTKLGITILLALFTLGIAFDVNAITQDYVKNTSDTVTKSVAMSDKQTLIELAESNKSISGSMLYSALSQYGDCVAGYKVTKDCMGLSADTVYGPIAESNPKHEISDLLKLVENNLSSNYVMFVGTEKYVTGTGADTTSKTQNLYLYITNPK